MFELLAEQQVAIYAVMHNVTVTKAEHRHLDLKDDQWELLSQMVTALKPLQMATTVFSFEQNISCSIIYPVINGLLCNHLINSEGDLSAVRRFKQTVAGELERRFAPTTLETARSLPVVCATVDPRYAHLSFLSVEQRQIAHEEVIGRMESIQATKLRNGKECADSNKQANGPRAKRKKKDSAMHFLLGTQSESESIGTCSDEMECFLKQPSVDPDLNALEWWREKAEEYPTLSEVAKQLLCIPATSVPSERIFSTSGNIVTKKRASLKPEIMDILVFLNKNLPPI